VRDKRSTENKRVALLSCPDLKGSKKKSSKEEKQSNPEE